MDKFRRLTVLFLIILPITMMPLGLASAAGGVTAPTLVDADSNDISHFSQSKNNITGKVNFLATEKGYAIRPHSSLIANPSNEVVSRSFLSVYGKHFGLKNEANELVTAKIKTTKDGRNISRFKQVYNNIPVYGGELVVDVDANNNLRSINGNIAPAINVSTSPTVSVQHAQMAALDVVAKNYHVFTNTLLASKPELIIFNAPVAGMNGGNESLLAWKFVVSSVSSAFSAKEPIKEQVIIDANNEKIINHFNLIAETKNRLTYDLQNTTSSPVLRRSEGSGNFGNTDIDNAHNFAGDTYDFYKTEHNRDSINNAGLTLTSKVHYSSGYCNAYWNGVEMTYGDGCAIVVDDVVAHELTHGVTEYESNLIYQGQSGAINEAFSDIWGEFVDLTNGQGTDTLAVRWLMGEDTSIGALRNMKNPPAFGDPDRIKASNYYCSTGDNGGVHYNSGVANKAAYLITDGDTFNGYTITGLGISKAADLFYEAQTNILSSSASYSSLYAALNQACSTLNYSAAECLQVNNAGLATEMNLTPCSITTTPCVASSVISVNSPVTGSLASTDCLSTDRLGSYQDVMTFPATAGTQYVITQNSTVFDSYLYLLNGTAVVASDDDSNGNLNSKISYTATASGTLTIHATSYSASVTGAYTLAVSAASTAPVAPTALTATTFSSSQINLAWTDASNNETGFKIERTTSATGTWTLIATTAANVVSYQNTGLVAGTTYYYRVRATNASGDSVNTSVVSLPAAPTALTATVFSSSQINLTWTDASKNETGFKIERSASATGTWTLIATTAANVVSYQNTGLVPGTTYYYRVRATNVDGDSVNTSVVSATTLLIAPAAPTTLTATAFSSSQINLAWTDNSNNETGFKIERGTSTTGPWTLIATTAANVVSYQNTGLTAASTYYYRVRATNAAGDSVNTSVMSAITLPIAPAVPTALKATAFSSSQINLTWTDKSSNEIGFKIEQGSSTTGPWTLIATTTANAINYQNTGLTAGTYYYRVRATNAGGDSVNTSVVSATTLPAAPTALTTAAVSSSQTNLAWTDNSSNEIGFKIERGTSTTGPWTLIATTVANAINYQNTGLAAGTYYYRVRATNAGGYSAYTDVVSATTLPIAPAAPTNLKAVISSLQINLAWTDKSSNEIGFKVERSTSATGTWTLITTTTANVVSYQNTGLTAANTYYYRVRATNAGGDSASTSTVSATIALK